MSQMLDTVGGNGGNAERGDNEPTNNLVDGNEGIEEEVVGGNSSDEELVSPQQYQVQRNQVVPRRPTKPPNQKLSLGPVDAEKLSAAFESEHTHRVVEPPELENSYDSDEDDGENNNNQHGMYIACMNILCFALCGAAYVIIYDFLYIQ